LLPLRDRVAVLPAADRLAVFLLAIQCTVWFWPLSPRSM
jgi:hypothetical protein